MIINIKGIYHERTEDAPFVGALICSSNCNIGCFNCFNQHLKSEPIIKMESYKIITQVLSNPFNKGIILGGLEWTLQPKETKQLIKLARKNNLEVILYTGLNEDVFISKFLEIYEIPNIYIKFGRYDENLKCDDHKQYGVALASSNQKIIKTKETNMSKTIKVPIEICHDEAILPKYAKYGDAGMDICSVEDTIISSKETKVIKTGLKVAIPEGYEIQVRPRSGLSLNTGIRVANSPGTIDSGYRNEIGIILQNTSDKPFVVHKGDRIAQIILKEVPTIIWKLVDEVASIGEDRGGGFGHTGINSRD